MLLYPYTLTPDTNGTLLVAFKDVPEANTCGDNEQDAGIQAWAALNTAIDIYEEQKRPFPLPALITPPADQPHIPLHDSQSRKILMQNYLLGGMNAPTELFLVEKLWHDGLEINPAAASGYTPHGIVFTKALADKMVEEGGWVGGNKYPLYVAQRQFRYTAVAVVK